MIQEKALLDAPPPMLADLQRVTVTPEIATEWLRDNGYEQQRKVTSVRIGRYVHAMETGAWQSGRMIEFAILNGRRYLIDGQHRLHAVVRAGKAQTFVVQTHRVATEEDLARLYGVIDTNKTRNDADFMRALGMSNETGLNHTQVRRLVAAVKFLSDGCRHTQAVFSNDELAELVRTYAPYALRFFNATIGTPTFMRNSLERQSTLGVALLTLRFSAVSAKANAAPDVLEFWRGVAADDRLGRIDPRKQVIHYLQKTTHSSQSARDGKEHRTPMHSARALAFGFNAYMERKTLDHLKVYDESAPLRLWGCKADTAAWLAID